ncbi:MAG: alanine--glyoxylate aminotransferase family protein, partial [Phycisphaerae bacterium]|nr:alanine--glyoxylate aminotransferase family protein [Phycisphaerae bacterium]
MSKIRLFTPGPTGVPEEVLLEMARPIFHHRTSQYRDLLKQVTEGLQDVLRSRNEVLTFTGSGTSAMEAGIVCCLGPGAKALVVRGGKFGQRWAEVCEAYGLDHINIDVEWSRAVDPAVIEKALADDSTIKAVIVTHSETSTGVRNDVEAIGKIVAPTAALFMVDCITS